MTAASLAALLWVGLAAHSLRALAASDGVPLAIKFASVGGITDAGLYLAEEFGYFREAGLAVDMRRMDSAPSLLAAIATDRLDVAGISVTPGLFASVQRGLDLRVVGDKQSIRPGFSATRLVARKDLVRGTIAETLHGLEGRTVAVSAKASMVYMLLRDLLAENGMSLSNLRVVDLSYPNMLAAFAGGAIDAAVDLEPFLSQAIVSGRVAAVSDLVDVVPADGASLVPLVYSEKFARDRKAGDAFMLAYMKGVRAYNDAFVKGIDKEKVIAIVARRARIDPKLVRDGYPAGIDPNQRVGVAALGALQRFFVEQHFLEAPVDLDKVVDGSFAEAAVRALGVYR